MELIMASGLINICLRSKYNEKDKNFVKPADVVEVIPPELVDGRRPRKQYKADFEGGRAILTFPRSELGEFFVKVVEK